MTISSSKNLLNALQKGTQRTEISLYLRRFKERGIVAFDKVLAIPSDDRITSLVKDEKTRYALLIAITASLKSAFNSVNLSNGMNEDQILDLSDLIIFQSEQDNLSLEDVLLFLQRFVAGESGKLFNRLDIPTFFDLFEKYRQERHEKTLEIREEQHANFKALGRDHYTNSASNIDKNIDASTIQDLLKTIIDDRTGTNDDNRENEV